MKILVSAIEISANNHLRELLKYLDCEIFGIFSKNLGKPNYDLTNLAIMGFVDAISKIPFFLRLKKEMVSLAKEADIVLLIDGSGFNLPLLKDIRKKYPNKKIIYYILPQAWAWRRYRIKILEENATKLCSIIKFEKKYYSKNITYVGHPLLDTIKKFKTTINKGKIAFLPGSRNSEIKSLMPIFRDVAKEIDKEKILVIPKNKNLDIYGDISMFNISYNLQETLYESEFAFICSGTATLEASIIGCPFVLVYKAKKIDYFLAKMFVKLKYIGLANLFFEDLNKEEFHKELLQDDVNKENLLEIYKNEDKNKFIQNSVILRKYLQSGSSKKVADIIIDLNK